MEPVLVEAYRQMLTTRGCSVDRIIEYPELRAEFLSLVRGEIGDRPEGDVFHELNNLRKKRKLPRREDVTTPAS